MKILLDSCVWGGASTDLHTAGHDVRWVGAWDEDPGDQEILQRACTESRILVTLDRDFGELAIVQGIPHSGIIRLVGISARQQGAVLTAVLERYGATLVAGSIVTIERGRVRLRPPDGETGQA